MDVTPVVSLEKQLIGGYGDGGFTITGVRHEGSVLVLPDQTLHWSVAAMTDLRIETLASLWQAEPVPAILLLGCGRGMIPIPRDIRLALKAQGIVAEPMDTGAACRTYNVLLTEGRDVAAALVAI